MAFQNRLLDQKTGLRRDEFAGIVQTKTTLPQRWKIASLAWPIRTLECNGSVAILAPKITMTLDDSIIGKLANVNLL